MAGRQYGLKIIHKPSGSVKEEHWFNTEDQRNTAMGDIKLHSHYTFDTDEKAIEAPRDAKPASRAAKA